MHRSSSNAFILAFLLAGAGIAVAQPPPPPPPGSGSNLPPLKQTQPPAGNETEGERDRRDQPRPRRPGMAMPSMNGVDMPEMTPVSEEPVTASGNIDLWRARIAERRARQESAATSSGGAPR